MKRFAVAVLGLVLAVGAGVCFVASHAAKKNVILKAEAVRDIPPICTPDFCP